MTKFTPGGLIDGRQVVTTAGTRVQLSTDTTEIVTVVVQAETDNTGIVCIGDDTVVAAIATRRGVALSAGDSVTLSLTQLHFVWLDSVANGDGVTFSAEVV